MKIAVCISGQIRTWKECYENWMLLFNTIKQHPRFIDKNVEIDFFIHTWNVNTVPPHMWEEYKSIDMLNVRLFISKEELDDVINKISPKKYMIDFIDINNTRTKFMNDQAKKYNNVNSLIAWSAPQLYSLMRCGQLKLNYEIENNFQYDVCMKMRFDMMFDVKEFYTIINYLDSPLNENTIYSMHSDNTHNFPYDIVGDIFFMSDSDTYNILSSFYNWIPTFKTDIFNPGLRIEEVFAYFIRMFNIYNIRTYLNPIIVRNDIKKILN